MRATTACCPTFPCWCPRSTPITLESSQPSAKNRGRPGAIVTNPNCSTIALALGLAPLKPFGIEKVMVTTMQAISGAGYPGLPAMDIVANAIPYIGGEEEKMEAETQKILGDFVNGEIRPLPAVVSAHCNRVQTIDGHLESVSVALAQKPGVDALIRHSRTSAASRRRRTCRPRPRGPSTGCLNSTARSRGATP